MESQGFVAPVDEIFDAAAVAVRHSGYNAGRRYMADWPQPHRTPSPPTPREDSTRKRLGSSPASTSARLLHAESRSQAAECMPSRGDPDSACEMFRLPRALRPVASLSIGERAANGGRTQSPNCEPATNGGRPRSDVQVPEQDGSKRSRRFITFGGSRRSCALAGTTSMFETTKSAARFRVAPSLRVATTPETLFPCLRISATR